MPEQKSQVSAMTALGVLFTLIAVVALVALVMLKSKADTATQEAFVGNDLPSVDSISAIDQDGAGSEILGGTLTLNEGTDNFVIFSGVISDPNGCEDIDELYGIAYRSGVTEACASDENNCRFTTMTLAQLKANSPVNTCDGAGDTDISFSLRLPMPEFTDPTDAGTSGKANDYSAENWVVKFVVYDVAAGTGTLTDSFEVASLAAFSTAASINYGTVALGADSNEQTVTFTNTGNMYVDATVAADADMSEPSGNYSDIPSGNVHYSTTQGFTYNTGDVAVVNAPATSALDLNLPQQTLTGGAPTVDSYWKLRMPTSGVNGTYTNTLTFTALSY